MGIDGLVSVTCHEDIEYMNRWKFISVAVDLKRERL